MGAYRTRIRRRLRAARPWLVVSAAAYATLFGAALVLMSVYYEIDAAATVVESVAGWLFLLSCAALGADLGARFVSFFRPNFEPGRPRDEHLRSTARWFEDDE